MTKFFSNGVVLLIQLFVKILTDLPQLLMDAVFRGLNVRIFLQILPDEHHQKAQGQNQAGKPDGFVAEPGNQQSANSGPQGKE